MCGCMHAFVHAYMCTCACLYECTYMSVRMCDICIWPCVCVRKNLGSEN